MSQQPSDSNSTTLVGMTGAIFFILVFLAVLGGLPAAERVTFFVIGLAVLIGVTMLFGFAAWHLLVRPLPTAHKQLASPLSRSQRQLFAVSLFVTQILLTVGGAWDEIWHITYGLPFGEDFFWRPHILLYTGFILAILNGMAAWYLLLTKNMGTFQQRFRADRLLGIIALFGAFMAYAVPADPIWHTIYGSDLTAWSIPHILLAIVWIMIAILGIGMQVSLTAQKTWRRLNLNDLISAFLAASIIMNVLLMFAVEWELANLSQNIRRIAENPDWLFPVFVIFVATLAGSTIISATRCYGIATLSGITAFTLRMVLVYSLDHLVKNANAWLLTLAPLVAMDIIAWWYTSRQQHLKFWMIGLASTVGMLLVSFPLINMLYIYPVIGLNNILSVTFAVLVAASLAAWIGSHVGNFFASEQADAEEIAPMPNQLIWLTPVSLVIMIVIIGWYIATAVPPTL